MLFPYCVSSSNHIFCLPLQLFYKTSLRVFENSFSRMNKMLYISFFLFHNIIVKVNYSPEKFCFLHEYFPHVLEPYQVTVFSITECTSYRDLGITKQCLTKKIWRNIIVAKRKTKRLKLLADNDGLFCCPVHFHEHWMYLIKRRCRKHVYKK